MSQNAVCTCVLLLAATIIGCSSRTESPAQLETRLNNTQQALVFVHTESFEESRVIQAAANLVLAKNWLGSSLAESCWKSEVARPLVQEACLLAWAPGIDPSSYLEGELLRSAKRSRNLTIAMIRRKSLAAQLSLDELLSLLAMIEGAPPWIRGIAIEEWLKKRDPIDLLGSQALWQSLGVNVKDDKHLDPASVSSAYRIARQLQLGNEEELFTGFCARSADSFAQVRCWRFLSALVDPNTGLGLDKIARSFLPVGRENGWVLFERSFPERAKLLRIYR